MNTTTALLDGVPTDASAALPLDAHGVLLGDSVFETMRAYGGRTFALGDHLDRLERSLAWARLTINAGRSTLESEIDRVARSIEGDAAVRIFIMRADHSARLAESRTRRFVFARPLEIRATDYTAGVSACVLPSSSFGTDASHAKYARYLPRLLARDEARIRGFDEALLEDDVGRIIEAATASVFALIEGTLVTSTSLDGITRRKVLDLARGIDLPCATRPIESRELEHASELFTTSSLRELVPIVRVGDRTIGDGTPGETTRALHRAFRALTI